MRNLGLATILVFVCNLAAASDIRYTEFECKSEDDALKCSSACEITGFAYSFIVNTSTGTVFQKAFYLGKPRDTNELKSCRVADANNWICGEGRNPGPDGTTDIIVEKFSDGIFSDIFDTHYPKNSGFKDHPKFYCAKKTRFN